MGIIIGKLRRKKTTVEVLETIDKEIKTIEEYRKNTEQTHKRIVGRFIVISVGVYLVTAFLFYFYYFPANFYDRLFYIIPLILAPVIILTVKRVLTWYYKLKISRKQNKLVTLRDEKKKLLEKVMETETYKVAKSILEKFSEPTVVRKSTALLPSGEFTTPLKQAITPTSSSTAITGGLRQRALPPSQQMVPSVTPARPISSIKSSTAIKSELGRTPMPPPQMTGMAGTPLPMPRTILPRERSVFDKMVDYLVGDGPSNRYALICKNCSSHNGMALHEEFEYISFRCCYCYAFNPARKKRPVAPKLEFELKSPNVQTDTSGSEKNSPSDTDSESDTLHDLKTTTLHQIDDAHEKTKTFDTGIDNIEGIEPMELDVPSENVEEVQTTEIEDEIKVEDKHEKETVQVTEEEIGDGDGTPKD
ncbi:hypothetical protein ILUMI_10436 [Ignelater luminosus]|uniref:Endoplasmic reticulum junction formation protein lunapark n=1 Tax=Ignelater luminosus TaxID=2038154 RepID=A0A8K0D3X3_IGNLU|nr:hypothetical protein ILUMI_10436 [Ignelater luminosus]